VPVSIVHEDLDLTAIALLCLVFRLAA